MCLTRGLWCAGPRTQGFVHAGQALHPLSYTPAWELAFWIWSWLSGSIWSNIFSHLSSDTAITWD